MRFLLALLCAFICVGGLEFSTWPLSKMFLWSLAWMGTAAVIAWPEMEAPWSRR
jgi:hypothetical protein